MWRDYDEEYEPYEPRGGSFTCRGTDRPCCGEYWVCEHGYRNESCQCGCSTDLCESCAAPKCEWCGDRCEEGEQYCSDKCKEEAQA